MSEPFDPYYKWLGIPPAEQPPHHYRLLGLNLFEGDPEVISNAADQRMVHLRVYQTGKQSAISQRLLNEISAARLTLLDAARKAAYDETLRASLAATPTVIDEPAGPPTPADLAAAEAEFQQRLAACNDLQRNYNALQHQSWLAKAAVLEADVVLRLRKITAGFPGGRGGLFAVVALTGLLLGIIGMAIISPSGYLLLFGAMLAAAFFAALGGHVLFLPGDDALRRWQARQRETTADVPERLQKLKAELTDARRLLSESQQRRDRLAAALSPPESSAPAAEKTP